MISVILKTDCETDESFNSTNSLAWTLLDRSGLLVAACWIF